MNNFKINTKDLKEAVEKAQKINTKKSSYTILNTIKFTVSKNKITLVKTDNEKSLSIDCYAITENDITDYSFLLNSPTMFLNFLKKQVKNNHELIIDFNENNHILTIKIKNNQFTFACQSSDDFPKTFIDMPDKNDFNNYNCVVIRQNELLKAINNVQYACSVDSIKPTLNGIYFHSEKTGILNLIGTDSRRMAISPIKINDDLSLYTKYDISTIIPLNSIKIIKGFLDKKESIKSVKMFFTEESTFFVFDTGTMIESANVDGQFSNYKQVVPSDYCNILSGINKAELLQALDDIVLFTREPAYKITMSIQDNKILFMADNGDNCTGQSTIDFITDNEQTDIKLGVNCQYMLEAAKNINSDIVNLKLSGVMNPIVLESYLNDTVQNQAIAMPIQIAQ